MTPKKRGRPSKRETLEKQGQKSLFERLEGNQEALDTVRTLLALGKSGETWRGMIATPPGSLLERVVMAFQRQTDIPLEIPFFATLHHLSVHLLAKEVTIDFLGNKLNPDCWTIILAPSGSSKTFAVRSIEKTVGDDDMHFPEPASAAKFIDDLAHGYNRRGWIQDEMGKFLSNVEAQQHLRELKGYLLQLYDGHRIERSTMKSRTIVDDPALSILGMSVLQTFIDELPEGSLVDGFAQRFQYVIAKKDPSRTMKDFPVYNLSDWHDQIRNEWDRVVASIQHDKYHVGTEGERAYRNAFVNLIPAFETVDESFFRRIMWRGVRYALLYHILLKKPGNEIDAEDMGWAARITSMHLQDASTLLTEYDLPELGRIVDAAQAVKDRVEKRDKRPVAARDLVRGVHGLKYASEARAILQLLE